MGANSGIAWTDHTFNPWWGCVEVSTACKSCYAREFAGRFGVAWGKDAPRRIASEKTWSEPEKWNRAAEKAGRTALVFCASMADVFEDNPQVVEARARLWGLIARTPALRWLLLTKRPENFKAMLPADWGAGWSNVGLGVTAEDQERAEDRVPLLLATPAAMRFVSCEPMLDFVRFTEVELDWPRLPSGGTAAINALTTQDDEHFFNDHAALDWIIFGGESGDDPRALDLGALAHGVDQCASAGVAAFVKQDSGRVAGRQGRIPAALWAFKQFPEWAERRETV